MALARNRIGFGDPYAYDVFISYTRREPDQKVALQLRDALETYRIPRDIDYPTRKLRAFIDSGELAAEPSLTDAVQQSLRDSRFLVVVCSTRSLGSAWVKLEVAFFCGLKRERQIIPVLLDGDHDAVVRELVPGDPVAVDLRAATDRKRRAKMREERLRIIAPVLARKFDDLRRRATERYIRGLTSIAVLSLALAATFSVVTYEAYVQRNEAQRQRNVAEEERQRADRQRELAEQRFRDALTVARDVVYSIDERLRRTAGVGDLRGELLNQARDLLDRLESGKDDDIERLKPQILALLNSGDERLVRREYDAAESYYEEALQKAELFYAAAPDSVEAPHGLGSVYLELGMVTLFRAAERRAQHATEENNCTGDPDDPGFLLAFYYFDTARTIWLEASTAHPENARLRVGLAEAWDSLGDVADALGMPDQRRRMSDRALEIWLDLSGTSIDDEDVASRASTSLGQRAKLEAGMGRPKEALAYFDLAEGLNRQLRLRSPNDMLLMLAEIHLKQGKGAAFEALGDLGHAIEAYRDAALGLNSLAALDAEEFQNRLFAASAWNDLGKVLAKDDQIAEARKAFKRSIDDYETAGSMKNAGDIVHVRAAFDGATAGDWFVSHHFANDARRAYSRAYRHLASVVASRPEASTGKNAELLSHVCHALSNLGDQSCVR